MSLSQNNNLAKSLSDAERRHLLHIVQLDAMTGNKESEALFKKLSNLKAPAKDDLSNVDIGDMVKEIDRRGMECRIRDKRPHDPANYTGVLSDRNWT